MSRKLVVLFSMLVLVGAMGLKAAVASRSDVMVTASVSGAPHPQPYPF